MGVESLVMAQDAPGNAGELVGQCDGELMPVQPLGCCSQPRAEAKPRPGVRDEDWKSVDVNTLIRGVHGRGIDSLPGIASVDFIDGVMRVFVNDWPNNTMFVTVIKSQMDADHTFAASETRKIEWPLSEGPVNLAPPIF